VSSHSAVLLLGLTLGASALHGQTPSQTPRTLQFPLTLAPGATRMSLGVSLIAMPAAIVQEAASIRWPLIGFDIKVGLPKHFVAVGTLSTEILTNHIEVGGRWVVNLNERLHADVGLGGAYWFGQLKRFGFDNNVHGWFTYPFASVGYDFGSMALTGQVKLSYINSLHIRNGALEAGSTNNLFNGFSYRITLEQPFWKHTTVGLSFQMNYLRFYYPQWPLFPTFDRYFWMPEAGIRFSL